MRSHLRKPRYSQSQEQAEGKWAKLSKGMPAGWLWMVYGNYTTNDRSQTITRTRAGTRARAIQVIGFHYLEVLLFTAALQRDPYRFQTRLENWERERGEGNRYPSSKRSAWIALRQPGRKRQAQTRSYFFSFPFLSSSSSSTLSLSISSYVSVP